MSAIRHDVEIEYCDCHPETCCHRDGIKSIKPLQSQKDADNYSLQHGNIVRKIQETIKVVHSTGSVHSAYGFDTISVHELATWIQKQINEGT